jgi:AbrB family looped-hinge helix DNA binding protein
MIVSHDAQIARQVQRVVAIRDGKTSSEVVRTTAVRPVEEGAAVEEVHHLTEYVVLDSAGRLQVPREIRERYNISDRVILEETDEGLVLRPVVREGALAVKPLVEPDEAPPVKKKGLLGVFGRKKKK